MIECKHLKGNRKGPGENIFGGADLEKKSLSLICPAYYDEKNIGPLVKRCLRALPHYFSDFEIIIVEDGSPDGTCAVVDELAAQDARVRGFHHSKNMGHGAALKTGIRESRFELVALMDGDGQYEPLDLPAMAAELETADLAQGRRVSYPNGRARYAVSRVYNMVVRLLFGAGFSDLGCSIKVMKRTVAEEVAPGCEGIFMQGELVLRAASEGFVVKEKDVMCYPRKHGRSSSLKLKNVAAMGADMLKLFFKLRAGK